MVTSEMQGAHWKTSGTPKQKNMQDALLYFQICCEIGFIETIVTNDTASYPTFPYVSINIFCIMHQQPGFRFQVY